MSSRAEPVAIVAISVRPSQERPLQARLGSQPWNAGSLAWTSPTGFTMLLNDWLCWIPWRRSKYDLGGRGEDLAAKHLQKLGCRILERQYRDPPGEIDLIAREGDTIVFVEVRSRSGASAGAPEETIGPAKERTLIRTAQKYLHRRKLDEAPARFDVVSIVWGDGAPRLEHFRDAIRPTG